MAKTQKDNLRESKKALALWDLKHGLWNPDLHCYQKGKKDNGH